MVQIIGQNKKAAKYLERIIKTLEDGGAHIDPDIQIHCTEYGMSMHSPHNKEPRTLIKLPHDLLLPRASFALGIHKGGFKLLETDASLSKAQTDLLKNMVQLYNATNQLKIHCDGAPWVVYKNRPDILEKLVAGRPETHTKNMLKSALEEKDNDNFIINSFLNTRLLKCKLYKDYRTPKAVLMPLIDCMNHTSSGAVFANDYTQKDACIYVNYSSPLDTDECFANYGKYDGLDTFLYYGFYDETAQFIRSVPVKFKLSNDVVISINSTHSKAHAKDLPDHVKDLAFYMPAITIDKQNKKIDISTLYIPSENAPLSLRRVLKFVLDNYDSDMSDEERKKYDFDH